MGRGAENQDTVSHPTQRAGRQAAQAHIAPPPTPVHVHHAPHAALLIDFDNVTLGIRSDLTKELRTLLNSDIIRGKVAVQRAYADWRRYPQYIVPLSESSIDLIFAPAFGTNKKNATDIRLAVDATELVFTRPEIGTFILLSGDSDFSSLVIKLKEYGKYVIGVGIRESASDLLIQNCDEYYSYSDLAGLTKEADTPSAQRDPWELVGEAVQQMARNGDVMRSDRLKQVMQQIDPTSTSGTPGSTGSASSSPRPGIKGLLKVSKLDNGQFEVGPATAQPRPSGPAEAVRPEENGRRGRGRRGRDRDRDRNEPAAGPGPARLGGGRSRGGPAAPAGRRASGGGGLAGLGTRCCLSGRGQQLLERRHQPRGLGIELAGGVGRLEESRGRQADRVADSEDVLHPKLHLAGEDPAQVAGAQPHGALDPAVRDPLEPDGRLQHLGDTGDLFVPHAFDCTSISVVYRKRGL